MKEDLRIPLSKSILFVVFAIAVISGCSNFDHPLPWSQSPIHKELPGSWHAVHELEPPLPIEITMNESGSLSVEMTVSDSDNSAESDSTEPSGSQIHRVTFQGDVLTSNDVHVLQIDMRTYKEHKLDGTQSGSSDRNGYRFLRVVSEKDSTVFQQLDIEPFARYAEAQFFDERTDLTASDFADCISSKIHTELASRILDDLRREKPTNWLTEEELSELERILKEFESRRYEPYGALQRMRECIAYKLPGDMLGRLFISDPDGSFSGETIRLVKVK